MAERQLTKDLTQTVEVTSLTNARHCPGRGGGEIIDVLFKGFQFCEFPKAKHSSPFWALGNSLRAWLAPGKKRPDISLSLSPTQLAICFMRLSRARVMAQQVCPLLLRCFWTQQRHRRGEDYSNVNALPRDELQIYTWYVTDYLPSSLSSSLQVLRTSGALIVLL